MAITEEEESRTPKVGSEARQLFEEAAETRAESVRRHAVDVLLDRRLYWLEPERFEAFVKALDNPRAPGPKLRALLMRKPAWRK